MALLARNSYLPGDKSWNPNLPCSADVVDCSRRVSWLTSWIFTSGRPEPEESSVTPESAPVDAVWARAPPVSKLLTPSNLRKDRKTAGNTKSSGNSNGYRTSRVTCGHFQAERDRAGVVYTKLCGPVSPSHSFRMLHADRRAEFIQTCR